MGCDAFHELISADLDGEVDGAERAALAAHLLTCAGCTAFAADAARLHRAARIAPASPMPDLSDVILERAAADPTVPLVAPGTSAPVERAVGGGAPDPAPPVVPGGDARRRRTRRIRGRVGVAVLSFQYGLLVVALLMMVLAVPDLFASTGDAVHTSRHLGGWDVAFAVGLVLAALQPWRARGLLPMAAALAGVMVVTAIVDIARGATPGMAEGTHVLEVLGLVFLWLLARSVPAGERPRRVRPGSAGEQVADPPASRLRLLPNRFARDPHLTPTVGAHEAGRRAA